MCQKAEASRRWESSTIVCVCRSNSETCMQPPILSVTPKPTVTNLDIAIHGRGRFDAEQGVGGVGMMGWL